MFDDFEDYIEDTTKNNYAAETLDFMQRGSYLVKVRNKSDKYRRYYRMENDFVTLHYKSKKMDCSNPDTTMSLTEIQEIREGALSDVFTKSMKGTKGKVDEERCFSLIHGQKHKTLDLIADDKNVRDAWVHGLKHLKKKLSDADLSTKQNVWMRELFKMADKDNDQVLTLKEILNLLKHLNVSVDYDTAKQVFDDELGEMMAKADTDKSRNKKGECSLDMDEFITFYKLLTSREEIEQLFHKYNYEGQYLDSEELRDFLRVEQRLSFSLDECEALIQQHEPCPNTKQQKMLSIDGFYSLFNSPVCDVFNMRHRKIYQDMTQPLSHYYIDSSHNTYLTSDQILGDSAVEAYIKALKLGCRCVELDCWDGDKGEPVIYHGHTFTSKILFKDVLAAVNMYAFETSEYPVILSIENHCSIEQQNLMAQYIISAFGDKLLTQPYSDDIQALPSLESLKGRIIIKAKKLPSDAEDDQSESEEDDDDEDDDDDESTVKRSLPESEIPQIVIPSYDEVDQDISVGDISARDLQGDIQRLEVERAELSAEASRSISSLIGSVDERMAANMPLDGDSKEPKLDISAIMDRLPFIDDEGDDKDDDVKADVSEFVTRSYPAWLSEEKKVIKVVPVESKIAPKNEVQAPGQNNHDEKIEESLIVPEDELKVDETNDEPDEIIPDDEEEAKKLKTRKPDTPDEAPDEVSDEDEAAEIDNEEIQKQVNKHKKKLKLAKQLSDLVVICISASFKSFDFSQKNYNVKQMSSIGESKAMNLAENQPELFIKHNTWQLTRNYPGGMRTDSSNYDPMPLWLVGSQIVALNYQTSDDGMYYYRGQFEDNGGCGYVLKPEFLRTVGKFKPSGPYDPSLARKIIIKIISGYQLPKKRGDKARSILDPYIKLDVHGVQGDNKNYKTSTIKNNGFHPIWNESFEFDVKVPDVALLRLQVLDYQDIRSNVMVAQYCLPVTSLQPGYRVVHLKNKYMELIRGANLFLHVTITK